VAVASQLAGPAGVPRGRSATGGDRPRHPDARAGSALAGAAARPRGRAGSRPRAAARRAARQRCAPRAGPARSARGARGGRPRAAEPGPAPRSGLRPGARLRRRPWALRPALRGGPGQRGRDRWSRRGPRRHQRRSRGRRGAPHAPARVRRPRSRSG
jgi:hypothetical protein